MQIEVWQWLVLGIALCVIEIFVPSFTLLWFGLGALLVRSLGVLVTGLGMIAGQLLGSLGLDLLVPTAGTVVEAATVLGTLLTLASIVVATLPWPKGAFRR